MLSSPSLLRRLLVVETTELGSEVTDDVVFDSTGARGGNTVAGPDELDTPEDVDVTDSSIGNGRSARGGGVGGGLFRCMDTVRTASLTINPGEQPSILATRKAFSFVTRAC